MPATTYEPSGQYSYVLLDIEGTVCPISFVRETLIPYAQQILPNIIESEWDSVTFASYRDAFPAEARTSPTALQAYITELVRHDVKDTALKALQGYIWREGYASGALVAPLFADVSQAMHNYRQDGVAIAIYSSGSVDAQKLLFQHTRTMTADCQLSADSPVENLTGLIDAWFDTRNAGPKVESASYVTIANALKCDPGRILFISDNLSEVSAALDAGLSGLVIDRPGNALLGQSDKTCHTVIDCLPEVNLLRG